MAPFKAQGAFTALVTPLTNGGAEIDWTAYEKLVESQVRGGVAGLAPCGTTGESPTLSADEKHELVRRAVAVAAHRAWVMAGIGGSDTRKAEGEARAATQAGAHALMLVVPAYSRPSQSGLADHVQRVADASHLPVVVYNVPARTGVHLEVDTLLEIAARCPNVVGLKDASGSVTYCQQLLARNPRRLQVLCGDDALTVAMMAVGARGVVSVTGNVLPQAVSGVTNSMLAGNLEVAREQHLRLLATHEAMFCAPSPGPVKAVLAERGLVQPLVRPPLDMPTPGERARVVRAVQIFEG